MKSIKLSGREMAVLRAIETVGSTGGEIADRTQITIADLADILGALCEVGYVEGYVRGAGLMNMEAVKPEDVAAARFEINPSYALELKKALVRS